MLDSDRVDVQYFLRAVDSFYSSRKSYDLLFQQCPVKASMKVFTSDFRWLSGEIITIAIFSFFKNICFDNFKITEFRTS